MSYLGASKDKTETVFYRLLGKKIYTFNKRYDRKISLKRGSIPFRFNRFLKEIISNLGMAKDNVTPTGLLIFISSVSLALALLFSFWSGDYGLLPVAFVAVFFFIITLFHFLSLTRFERKEAEIMDTEDLIAMDVKGGVYNAIVRYRKAFHPNIRPYFEEFIDNVQYKGFSFKESMLILNGKLGDNFTSFAQKAILYEEKASEGMEDIFTTVVDINRQKRDLRYENNIKFASLRLEFIMSTGIIIFYAFFSMSIDPFISYFLSGTYFGKVMLIVDLIIVTAVLGYIASIKAKFL